MPHLWCFQWTNYYPPPTGFGTSIYTEDVTVVPACVVNGKYVYYGDGAPGTFGPNMPWLCGQSGPLTTSLVDPAAAQEVAGNSINQNPNTVASISNTVLGVAADGTAEIVLRIDAPTAGTALTLSLVDENGNPAAAGSQNALGYLKTLLTTDAPASTAGGTPITVTTVAVTGSGSMAFAVYVPPKDFVRDNNSSDPILSVRTVSVQISGSGLSQQQPIEILRPPVAFVHGIWGGPFDGSDILSSLLKDNVGLMTYAIDYAGLITILSSSPTYGSGSLTVSGANLGFQYDASDILPDLYDAIVDYRTDNLLNTPIAVAQADIVAHSMGGDITRYLPLTSGFSGDQNYDLGPVHKLITIGTPHLGSPLAIQLLQSSNTCVAKVLGWLHHYAFSSVLIYPNVSYTGGIADLQGDINGTLGSLGPDLFAIQPGVAGSTATIPTAMIAASMTSTQLNAVNSSKDAFVIRKVCGSAPLAADLTSSGWQSLLSNQSDAIVPVNSQLAGSTTNTRFPLGGEVHSPGTEYLGFAGPSELDDMAVIAPEVLQLLNTPVDNQVVFPSLP